MHWIYLIHEFHNLSWITEINELFHDILIYWDAPVYYFCGLCTHSSVWKVSSAHRGECVTTGGLYRPTHLCVAHFGIAQKKFLTVFFFGVVRFGGGCPCSGGRVAWGFRGGQGDLSSGLSQPGKKLLSSLAERALMLRYRLPDGRSWKRLWRDGGILPMPLNTIEVFFSLRWVCSLYHTSLYEPLKHDVSKKMVYSHF